MPPEEQPPQENQSQQLEHQDPGDFGPEIAPPIIDLIRCADGIAAGEETRRYFRERPGSG
jgi:hypothetical protein